MASIQDDEGVSAEQTEKLTQEIGVLEEKPAISEEAEVVVHEGEDEEEEKKPVEETENELKEEEEEEEEKENVGLQIIGDEAEPAPTFDDDDVEGDLI